MESTQTGTIAERRLSMEVVAGGSTIETLGGIGAVVLCILGLAGVLPSELARVATIAIGASLLFEGAAVASRLSKLLTEVGHDRLTSTEIGGGMTVEVLGGIGGVVLGLLALLAVMPAVLMSVAVVVFGGVLLLGASVVSRLNALSFEISGMSEHGQRAAREAVNAAAGVQVLFGLSALTLGILALVGIGTPTLILVGLLTTGAAIAFSGTALTSRMIGNLTA